MTRKCEWDGCDKPHLARGLCCRHLQWPVVDGIRVPPKRTEDPPEMRFWKYVDKNGPNGCWAWTGVVVNAGRGRIKAQGRFVTAPRFSYELNAGEIPDGMFVLHMCDNANCVNPEHLFLGTHRDNMRDKAAKGRSRNGSTGKLGPEHYVYHPQTRT